MKGEWAQVPAGLFTGALIARRSLEAPGRRPSPPPNGMMPSGFCHETMKGPVGGGARSSSLSGEGSSERPEWKETSEETQLRRSANLSGLV